MAAALIDGEAVAEEIRKQVSVDAAAHEEATGSRPKLVAVQVGENPASTIYTNMQARSCEEVGIEYDLRTYPEDTSESDVLAAIAEANRDPAVSGMILQMPLPAHLDTRTIQQAVAPDKDVEGIGPVNLGKLFYGGATMAPCTPLAVMELLTRACDDLAGKEAVVVGHSEIVGKPIAMMLLVSPNASPTVRVCHVATRNLAAHTKQADILIVAAGVSQAKWRGYSRKKKAGETPGLPDLSPLVSAEMVKDGAIVIDVAINRIPKGFDENGEPLKNDKGKTAMKTVGDVDFDAVKEKASAITPVPGGVGPVTVAKLLQNTLACAKAGRG